ncbi:MAG TPA: endonuclease MutS2 [Bacteroidota bacterium]|nr:endonuclease MutS2 [Bacteroidota bacterium]
MPDRAPFSDAIETLEFARIRSHIAGYCASGFGRARVEALEPSIIPAEINDELARVTELRRLLDADDTPPLDDVADIRPALHRAAKEGSMVLAEDCLHIVRGLKTMRGLRAFLLKRRERLLLLTSLAEALPENKALEFHIERVIDDEGNVKDNASKQLRAIRQDIIEKSGHLRRRMEGILKRVSESDMVMEELVTMRDGRMVLPVKAEFKRQIQGFIHSTSATGQTVYIEPSETLELNNDIRDLQFAEVREIATILTELTARVRPEVEAVLRGLEAYAEIDALYARARYARDVLASCPRVQRGAPLRVQQARHPVLLLHKKLRDVIPLDITIGDAATTIIITGPNAGGKSVAMKTVGLIALMAQSGMPVPCDEESTLPVYENVLVDIGDEQSLENDLSTFSSHISRLARIVDAASERTLVLIDEIGTGTDPSEGSALGAAILEHLTALRAHVIATTHHGMLKAFAHEHEGMENAAMEFDLGTLQPTYQFRAGLPGSSYAFEITRRHGMTPAIIERARSIVGTQSDALEHLLAEVEKQSQDLGNRLRASEQLEREYRELAREYEEKLRDVRKELREVKQRSLEEARRILDDANAAVESTIRELRENKASKEAIRAAHEQLDERRRANEQALRELVPEQTRHEEVERPFMPGDEVYLAASPATRGTVLDVAQGKRIEVAFGSMRMQVEVDKLRRYRDAGKPEPVRTQGMELVDSNEIDIRGMYGDEAIRELDRFLLQAWSSGLLRVDIIHGKGTGALRSRVHAWLRDLHFVESFQLGEWNEGGSGMTRVTFRAG